MAAPTKVRLHAHLEGQGDYPHDPRLRVGTHENGDDRAYTSKENIDINTRYKGMLTVDDNGVLWVLKGGIGNEFYVDVLGALQAISEKNQSNGYAGLDSNGKLSSSVLPGLAIGSTYVRASEAAMLDLRDLVTDDPIVAEEGDIVKRTDNGKTYILQGADQTQLGSWVDISSNVNGVESVNGKTGAHIVLTVDDIDESATRKYVTPTEKTTWNNKQEQLSYDEVPTFQSTAVMTSGALFEYLKTIQSSVTNKSWLGSAADGNNRFQLAPEDADIDQIIFVTEDGVHNHEGVHFTIDPEKRYIQWNEAPAATKTYYLKYLSNIPVVSLTSVAMANVNGLLDSETGKIKEENLPAGVGGAEEVEHTTALKFNKHYTAEHTVAGAIAYTFNAGSEETNDEAKLSRTWLIYLKADGINKPTFSGDFSIQYDGYNNTLNTINRLRFEYVGGGKVLVSITYV